MRLLVCTQAVDTNDPVLGFFVGWIAELSKEFDSIEVLALKADEYSLPSNVRVHSLGKEKKERGRLRYSLDFFMRVWTLRNSYDAVFVHMNQEYLLICGPMWKLLGKKVYLWRNHYAGNILTDIAALFCDKVFCTSRYSYTKKYRKTELMPVGIDTEKFKPTGVPRKPHSILFLARIAPSKRAEILIDALEYLRSRNTYFSCTIVGSALPRHASYLENLKQKVKNVGLDSVVIFLPGVPPAETPALYNAHEIFVNTSPSGMYDKTILEAAACGAISLAASQDYKDSAGIDVSFGDSAELADKLQEVLVLSDDKKDVLRKRLRDVVITNHSIPELRSKLAGGMKDSEY